MTPIVAILEPGEIRVAGVDLMHRSEHCIVIDIDCISKRPVAGPCGMGVMLEADEHTLRLDRHRKGRPTLVRFEGIDTSPVEGFTDWFCEAWASDRYAARALLLRLPERASQVEMRTDRVRFFRGWAQSDR